MIKDNKRKVKCDDCGKEIIIPYTTFRYNTRNNKPFRCPECRKKHEAELWKQRWENMTDEEKKAWGEKSKKIWTNLSDDKKKEISNLRSENRKKYWNNLTEEEKKFKLDNMNEGFKNYWNNLSEEGKKEHAIKSVKNFAHGDPAKKQLAIIKRVRSVNGHNKLHEKFENKFQNSIINDAFYYISEYSSSNKKSHCWDYGIFNQNGELECLVDLDGAYFHGDGCDYDGIHSHEEYDESRGLSIPDGVKWCIINELNFDKTFNYLEIILRFSYLEFMTKRFHEYRNIPFPQPHYTDSELLRSFELLQRMDCNDKYHKSISMNTRIGDRIIQHFHTSLYNEAQTAWYDGQILKSLMDEKSIYQSYLNKNKIVQGLNVSEICPSIRFISPAIAKMIISRYLSIFREIFNPNNNYSGIMLGTISLGKHYIGYDDNLYRINEAYNIIHFLQKYSIIIDATIFQTCNFGNFQSLFTVVESDEQIDLYMKYYTCKRYVFIINHTEIYKDFVVDIIESKTLNNENKELIIIEGN